VRAGDSVEDITKLLLRFVAEQSSGFVYLVSVLGITGERDALPLELGQFVARVRDRTQKPLAVGFGISKPEHVKTILENGADGAIIGSAFVRIIEKYQNETRSRASWSFFVALVAMFFGFGFVVWGGTYVLAELKWDNIAAGALIASIGGSISAFLAKTFLDVHRLSLPSIVLTYEH